jgi:AMP deaminase
VYFDKKENKTYTLEAVLDMLNVKDEEININSLEVKADHTIFQRFDRFNEKYNPMGLP